MMFLRHLGRVLGGLVAHAVRTRSVAVLVLAALGGIVVVATVVVQVVGPVALYPFL